MIGLCVRSTTRRFRTILKQSSATVEARRLLIGVTEDSKASMEESRNESPVNRKYKPECEPDRNFDNPSLLLPKLKNIIHKSSIFSLYLITPFNVAKNFNNPIIVIK